MLISILRRLYQRARILSRGGRIQRDPTPWHNLRRLEPMSRLFGLDRGTPVDRHYIEAFLAGHAEALQGRVMEIAEDTYTRRFGQPNVEPIILDFSAGHDLTRPDTLPARDLDAIVCTQTLNFIPDAAAAVAGLAAALRPGGTALVTVAGISQISRYDMDRWGDFWRFTDRSIRLLFEPHFESVDVVCYGNVLTATALLHGVAKEELEADELAYHDQDYQLVLGVHARKG